MAEQNSSRSRWTVDPSQLILAASYSLDMVKRVHESFRSMSKGEEAGKPVVDLQTFQTLLEKNGVHPGYADRYYSAFNRSRSGKVDEKEFSLGMMAMDVTSLGMNAGPDGALRRSVWKLERARYIFDTYSHDPARGLRTEDVKHMARHLLRARGCPLDHNSIHAEIHRILTACNKNAHHQAVISLDEWLHAVERGRIKGLWSLFRLSHVCPLLQYFRDGNSLREAGTCAFHEEIVSAETSALNWEDSNNSWNDEGLWDVFEKTKSLATTISSRKTVPKVTWNERAACVRVRKFVLGSIDHAIDSASFVAKKAVGQQKIRNFLLRSTDAVSHHSGNHSHIRRLLSDIFSGSRSDDVAPDPRIASSARFAGRYGRAPLAVDDALAVISAASTVLRSESAVIRVAAPVRCFGDLHGQFSDMMKYFSIIGFPCDWVPNGDIAHMSYLFLGDIVDRGRHSLECLFSLLLLKIQYPQKIFILRGNHEDPSTNTSFGFLEECEQRFGASAGRRIFREVNERIFAYLSPIALIEDSILCVHGGIGRTKSLDDMFRVAARCKKGMLLADFDEDDGDREVFMDMLWSDPTDSDAVEGIHPNSRGPSVCTFGPDVSHSFLQRSNLQMLLRAHQVTSDGVGFSAAGRVVTLFSATAYMGHYENHGAILEITWKDAFLRDHLSLQAKIIHSDGGGGAVLGDIAMANTSRNRLLDSALLDFSLDPLCEATNQLAEQQQAVDSERPPLPLIAI
eukprot:ANDGO_07092.mRNA.1 Serine/threonine-protein phosphatase BSL1